MLVLPPKKHVPKVAPTHKSNLCLSGSLLFFSASAEINVATSFAGGGQPSGRNIGVRERTVPFHSSSLLGGATQRGGGSVIAV